MKSYNTLKQELDVPVKSIDYLSKKHNKSLDYMNKQLNLGISIEHEHSKDYETAKKIALAHLGEMPDYYIKLKKYVE